MNQVFVIGSCDWWLLHQVLENVTLHPIKGLFTWRWAGPVKRAGSPRSDDFYPTFTWNLLSQLSQVFFTIKWRKDIMQNKCSYIIN